jgi:hypothetical protein
MKRLIYLLPLLISLNVEAFWFTPRPWVQLAQPKMDASDKYKTKMTLSWTKPTNTVSFTAQRATNSTFTTGLTTIYTGGQQVFDDASLVEHTTYYYRVKAEAPGFDDSPWSETVIEKTWWTPWAYGAGPQNPSGRSGPRFANSTDVTFYGGNVNLGDFIIPGWNSGNSVGGEFDNGFGINSADFGPFGTLDNKVVFIGDIAYSWVQLDMNAWAGTSAKPRIITNSGGQVLIQGLELQNVNHVKLTGRYDATAKTGAPGYLGFDDPDYSNLNGKFGFHFRGNYYNTNNFCIHITGLCSTTKIEYFESGEGGYTALSVKNDGYALKTIGNAYRTFSVPNTGAGVYATISFSDVYIPFLSDQLRVNTFEYFPPAEGNLISPYKVNWVEFEHNTTHVITRVQTEGYIGALRASTTATADADGSEDLNLLKDNSAADYVLGTPLAPGSYTVRARVSSSITGGVLALKLGTPVFDSLEVAWGYFHDSRQGELTYSGSTQPDPQQPFSHLWVHNCVFARAGLNAIQTGQLIGPNRVNNIVAVGAATAWDDAFQRFQDQSTQQSSRTQGYRYDHNLIIGGGESSISSFAQRKFGWTNSSADTNKYDNNAFLNILGSSGGYINTKDPAGQKYVLTGNIFGRMVTDANKYIILYPWSAPTNHVITFESSPDPVFTQGESEQGVGVMRVGSNIYDFSVAAGGSFATSAGYTGNITIIDSGTNVRQATVPYPTFSNFMDLPNTYDFATIGNWVGGLSPQWNFNNWVGTSVINTSTTTNIAIPTTHPTSVTFTIGGWEGYHVGDTLILDHDIYSNSENVSTNSVESFVGIVTAYNTGTGSMTISSLNNNGTGTFNSNWTVSKVRHYGLGQIVAWRKRFYKSLVSDNAGREPSPNGDSFWQLLVFSNGSIKPPDDVRLAPTDYYYLKGIGLGIASTSSLLANAGVDISVNTSFATLDATLSTAGSGHTISAYTWTKIAGPGTTTILNNNTSIATATNLEPGTYIFRITVTQEDATFATDDITVIVTNVRQFFKPRF